MIVLIHFRLRVVKQLVLQEVDAVFGDSDRDCSVQDAAELKYLECCIKETLRLYPSVPAIMRCLTEDIEIGQRKKNASNRILDNLNFTLLLYRWLQTTIRDFSRSNDSWYAPQP